MGFVSFTDFGWDVLERMNGAGYSVAKVDVFSSVKFDHLGGGQTVFSCIKKNVLSDNKG